MIEVIDLVHRFLGGIQDECLAPFLAAWPRKPFKSRPVSANSLPVLTHLHTIAVQATTAVGDIVKGLQTVASMLDWRQTYTAGDVDAGFLEKYGWTELVGKRGPVTSNDLACGFLLLGPDTEYPMHRHEAEEVYLPLNSRALWINEDGGWSSRPCGVPIYHRSWLGHAMRSGSDPLLALYLWRGGDLVQKSLLDRI